MKNNIPARETSNNDTNDHNDNNDDDDNKKSSKNHINNNNDNNNNIPARETIYDSISCYMIICYITRYTNI